jgi:hypothetical protein
MWRWILANIAWITTGEFLAFVTVLIMFKNTLYRYVLRRLEETRTGITLFRQMHDDDARLHGVYISDEEVIANCRLLCGWSSTPSWLAHLAMQWEEHKKKGHF